jgi:RNA polymerase sigma factor (sigma-70 family)
VDYSAVSSEDLARACLEQGNELAWAEFVRRFHPLIAGVVLRVSRQWGVCSAQASDDLVQETYLKLCAGGMRSLQNFKSTHKDAIYGYVKVFTANLVRDHFKSARSQKRGGGTITSSIEGEHCSPKLPLSSATIGLERHILLQEIDSCLNVIVSGPESERDRRIFWLYYRVGLTASAIAGMATIGLSTKGVESTLLRLTRQMRVALSRPEAMLREKLREGIGSEESFS